MIALETLRRLPYFAGVSSAVLPEVAEIAAERDVKAGEPLFREGDEADSVFIVENGEIDIFYELAGGERRVVDTVGPNELLCWSAMVGPHQTTASAIAKSDAKVLAIHGAKFRTVCESDPFLGYRVMSEVTRVLSRRLRSARQRLGGKA